LTRSRVVSGLVALKLPGMPVLDSYGANFAREYDEMPRAMVEGVVFKRRSSIYVKQRCASTETRDWLKRRFAWD
jgi:hypothetical protein